MISWGLATFKYVPSRQQFWDLCPAVAQAFMSFIDDVIFFLRPGGFFHLWVEVVVPALSALFAYAAL